ncbi:MAG: hypothetical protein ACLSBH_13400 [Coprobacillus cateniformis]
MKKNFEIKAIYWFIIVLFACFLVLPLGSLLIQSFQSQGNFSFANYIQVIGEKGFLTALQNSFLVSGLSALITTFLAFMMAYAIHYTNMSSSLKEVYEEYDNAYLCCYQQSLMDLRLYIHLENKDYGQRSLVISSLIFMAFKWFITGICYLYTSYCLYAYS